MSEISEFANRDIFPLAYEIADQIFPEFEFRKQGNKWISGNGRKIDGSEGEKHKVYIYADSPYYLKDYTREGKAITTYLIEAGLCIDWIGAIEYLARKVGVQLPQHNLSHEDIERIAKKEQQQTLLETINDFFITSLLEEQGSDANAIREHLDKRGYTDYLPKSKDELHLGNKMKIGFIPSREKLKEYLKSIGSDPKIIDDLFMQNIGATHIVIPFRVLGRIIGFAFRNINWTEKSSIGKYLNSNKLDKSSVLFDFKPPKNSNKDLVVVEGLFDTLHAKACGMDNIAALGGTSFNAKQAELISKYRYETVTLCLDNDSAGREATQRAIDEILKAAPKIKLHVASLPGDFKDPDELINSQGIESFSNVIKSANAWYSYLLRQRFEKYNELGEIPDKERDEIVNHSYSLASKITNNSDLDYFKEELAELCSPFGLSKETIEENLNKIKVKEEKERQSAARKNNINKAQALMSQGKEQEAIELLSNTCKQSNTISLESSYEVLLTPITEDVLRESLRNKPDNLISGLKIGGDDLLIPSGAITIIAAPTSHGKTSFLINLANNIAQEISNKPVYLFSYEESREAILLKAINTYINLPLSKNNRRSIESYFKTGDMGFMLSDNDCRGKFIYEKDKFFKTFIHSGRLNIFYSVYTSGDLIGAIHYLHKQGKISAVLIDYIQLLRLGNNKLARQEELKQICLDLKDCAVETGLPIILGAQFNREVVRPDLVHATNIGEAGDIERAASLIIGLWNNKFAPLDKKGKTMSYDPEDTIEATILKYREGESGIKGILSFDGNTGKISNQKDIHSPFSAKPSKVTPLSKHYETYEEIKDGF